MNICRDECQNRFFISEQAESRAPLAPEVVREAPRLANPARIPFSREDVRGIIATRLKGRDGRAADCGQKKER